MLRKLLVALLISSATPSFARSTLQQGQQSLPAQAPAAGPIIYLPDAAAPDQNRYTYPILNQTAFYLATEYMLLYSLVGHYERGDLWTVDATLVRNDTTGNLQAILPTATLHTDLYMVSKINCTLTSPEDTQMPVAVANITGKVRSDLLLLNWTSMATAPIGFIQAAQIANDTIANEDRDRGEKLVNKFVVSNTSSYGSNARVKNGFSAFYTFRTHKGDEPSPGNLVSEIVVGAVSGVYRKSLLPRHS